MACLTLDSYKVYFDIDADDIVKRIRGAFLHFYKPEHFRNNVMGATKTAELKGPDLYGPFWITMSLIFFIGVSNVKRGWKITFYFSLEQTSLVSNKKKRRLSLALRNVF